MLLIIEDEAVQRLTLAEIFVVFGKLPEEKMLFATNLTEARALLSKYGATITAVLSDNNLKNPAGEESGTEFLKELLVEQQSGAPKRSLYLHSAGLKPTDFPEEITFHPKIPLDMSFYTNLALKVMAMPTTSHGNLHTLRNGQAEAPSI